MKLTHLVWIALVLGQPGAHGKAIPVGTPSTTLLEGAENQPTPPTHPNNPLNAVPNIKWGPKTGPAQSPLALNTDYTILRTAERLRPILEPKQCSIESQIDTLVESALREGVPNGNAVTEGAVCADCEVAEAEKPKSDCILEGALHHQCKERVEIRFLSMWIDDLPKLKKSDFRKALEKYKEWQERYDSVSFALGVQAYSLLEGTNPYSAESVALAKTLAEGVRAEGDLPAPKEGFDSQAQTKLFKIRQLQLYLENELKQIREEVSSAVRSLKPAERASLMSEGANRTRQRVALNASAKQLFGQTKSYKLHPDFSDEFPTCGATAAEIGIIRWYTASGYRTINPKLWSAPDQVPDDLTPFVFTVNSGLYGLPKYFGPVARGSREIPEAVDKAHSIGATVTNKALTSTSSVSGWGGVFKWIGFSRVGRNVDWISTSQGEREILYPPYSNFQVLDRRDGICGGLTSVKCTNLILEDKGSALGEDWLGSDFSAVITSLSKPAASP